MNKATVEKNKADLTWANLTWANLAKADLSRANLSGANLTLANLTKADLSGADLTGATLNGASHALVAEILRRDAMENVQRRAIAGLILISRDWCWERFKKEIETHFPAEAEWAITVIRKYKWEKRSIPEWLRGVAQ